MDGRIYSALFKMVITKTNSISFGTNMVADIGHLALSLSRPRQCDSATKRCKCDSATVRQNAAQKAANATEF